MLYEIEPRVIGPRILNWTKSNWTLNRIENERTCCAAYGMDVECKNGILKVYRVQIGHGVRI